MAVRYINRLALVSWLLLLVRPSNQHPTLANEQTFGAVTHLAERSELTANDTSSLKTANYSTILVPYLLETDYAVEVSFNNEPHWLLADTGSSDTWMVLPDFQCVLADGTHVNQSVCDMGQPYLGSYEPIPGKSLNISYGDGQSASGGFGYVNVTVAGLTVRSQVGLVDRIYYNGTGFVSGLLGLAPGVTFQYATSNGSDVDGLEREHYSPVIDMVFASPLIEPILSVALQPGPIGGYLSFGGVPAINFEEDYVTVEPTFIRGIVANVTGRIQYPIQPDGITINGTQQNTSFKAILDSGTYVNRLPTALADQINAQYDPPAIYNETLDLYYTTCNATVPSFSVTIGGQTFIQPPEVGFYAPLTIDGLCTTTFFRGFDEPSAKRPDGYYCLGDVFMFNVVAAFGGDQFYFAPHTYAELDSQIVYS